MTSILNRDPVPFLKAFAADMARSSFAAKQKAFEAPEAYVFDGEDYLYLYTKQIDVRLVGRTVLRKFIHVYYSDDTLDVRALDDTGAEFELDDDLRDELKSGVEDAVLGRSCVAVDAFSDWWNEGQP